MCARFTVLSDTPIAAAIAGCVIPLSRNSTIWMRWRCGADIFHRNAVFSRRTSALLHLTICFPRIRWRKRITPRGRKTLAKPPDSSRYGGGIRRAAEANRYAAACIVLAIAAVDEAERSALEAWLVRQDANSSQCE